MLHDDYGMPERATLLALMFAISEIRNPDIEERFGIKVEKKARERLQKDKLIEVKSYKVRNAMVLELTDEGYRWCRAELARPVPDKAPPAYRLLYGVLRHLDHYLATPELESEFFIGASNVERQIRAAYAKLGGRPDEPVKLADLREELAAIPRGQLDKALLALDSRRTGALVPEAKQSMLTMADRSAAISIGGEEKHLLRIAR